MTERDLINAYKYLKCSVNRTGPLFSVVLSKKTRGNRHKLKQEAASEYEEQLF